MKFGKKKRSKNETKNITMSLLFKFGRKCQFLMGTDMFVRISFCKIRSLLEGYSRKKSGRKIWYTNYLKQFIFKCDFSIFFFTMTRNVTIFFLHKYFLHTG